MKEEKEVNQLHRFYSSPLQNKLRKLVEPLDRCFQLNSFFYSVVTNEGKFFQIGNIPELSEFYFSNQFYKHNPYICHPDNYSHNQVIITPEYPESQSHELQLHVKEKFGLGDTIVIYKKIGDMIHVLMPSSTHANFPLKTFYLNNFSTLNHFVDNFVNEWQQNLHQMESYMFNIADHIGPRFFKLNHSKQQSYKNQRKQFLRQIGVIKSCHFDVEDLTRRELDCIDEFLKGKTAAQIAEALELSRRTVEYYLDNIKTKLNCYTKAELFEKLQIFKIHNIL